MLYLWTIFLSRLGRAPNYKAKYAARYYRGELDCRPAGLINNLTLGGDHPDTHAARSDVKMVSIHTILYSLKNEYSAQLIIKKQKVQWAHVMQELVTQMSIDDKNNINDGPNPMVLKVYSSWQWLTMYWQLDRRTNYNHSFSASHDEARHIPDHDIRVGTLYA